MTDRPVAGRVSLKVRMEEPLRASLERAAEERGVSLNAEAVRRLEWSFAQEERLADVFGREGLLEATAGMLDVISERISREGGEDQQWIEDRKLYSYTLRIACKLLNKLARDADVQRDLESFPKSQKERQQRRLEEARERLESELGTFGIER